MLCFVCSFVVDFSEVLLALLVLDFVFSLLILALSSNTVFQSNKITHKTFTLVGKQGIN